MMRKGAGRRLFGNAPETKLPSAPFPFPCAPRHARAFELGIPARFFLGGFSRRAKPASRANRTRTAKTQFFFFFSKGANRFSWTKL